MMTEEAALKVHFDAKILIYSVAQNRKVVHKKTCGMLKNLTDFTGKKRERNVFSAIYTQKGGKREREGGFLTQEWETLPRASITFLEKRSIKNISHCALCFVFFRLKKHVGLLFSSAFAFAVLHSKFFRKNPKKG